MYFYHHAVPYLYRATALAIFSMKNGLEALKTYPTKQLLSTPLQLLIIELPGKNLPSLYSMQFTVFWYKRCNIRVHMILNYTVACCRKVMVLSLQYYGELHCILNHLICT